MKIRLGHFLGMFYVWQLRIKRLNFLQCGSMGVYDFSDFLQWGSMGVYDFSNVWYRRFSGINTDLQIDANLIPYTVNPSLMLFSRLRSMNLFLYILFIEFNSAYNLFLKASVGDLIFSNWYLFHEASHLLQWKNHRHPLTPIVNISTA